MALNTQQLSGQSDNHITWLTQHVGIHKDMLSAWQSLSDAALLQGFNLKIASGYRSFDRQLSIWNRKFSGELATKNTLNQTIDFTSLTDAEKVTAILLYSALPGTSRHHWGTDIDIYADNLLPENQKLQLEPWEFEANGPFEKLSIWLEKNSERFDFFLPYDIDRGGVAAEPWHLSYSPISTYCLCDINIDELTTIIEKADILGKKSILDQLPQIFSKYVTNIKTVEINATSTHRGT